MEQRTTSFVELRESESSPRSASRRSKRSSMSKSPSAGRPSASARPSALAYSEKDANAMILKANAPPNYNGGFDEIMKQIKAKAYYTTQFRRIQEQTGMKKSLYFSDVAPTFYESNYLKVVSDTSLFRVRACFTLIMVALAAFYTHERSSWKPNTTLGRTADDETAIYVLTFGVMIPTLFIGLMATFTPIGKRNLETISVVVFTLVAAMMIAKKPVEKVKGPVIPLLILLIPIFGITRMRFVKSCWIGWTIFFSYFIVMAIAREKVVVKSQFDDYTDISYQSINYGISVIGGMVSQYRQELVRRRNFCLQLPFSGTMDSDAVADIETDKFSKKALMHTWSQRFRNPEVEECFYRYWYLIDPFPYENPNSGSLHTGVFMTIRFAIMTLLLNQVVLLLQDIKFLSVKKDKYVDNGDLTVALVLRFGVTVPLYLSAALFMYFMGKAFYARWVKEAEEAKNKALMKDRNSVVMLDVAEPAKEFEGEPEHDELSEHPQTQDSLKLKLVVNAAIIKDKSKDRIMDVLINKGGYVRSTQIFSSLVIAMHVMCMGIILLTVSTGAKADALAEQGVAPGKPKPVYYMGFLNAVLFAHRSGFRVRFIYATYTTFLVAVGIVIAASSLSPDYYLEYGGYVLVIFLLGMMISYEEENLRRTFFVLKSIRTLEFDEWFGVVLRIQGWVKERFRHRLHEVRSKKTLDLNPDGSTKQIKPVEAPLVNTSGQMAQASRYGMYAQMFNIVIALVDVITSSV